VNDEPHRQAVIDRIMAFLNSSPDGPARALLRLIEASDLDDVAKDHLVADILGAMRPVLPPGMTVVVPRGD
jgi:hypothetical protein